MTLRDCSILLALAGCADEHSPAAPPAGAAAPREVVMATRPLQPGELGEATLSGGPGDRAVLRLRAPLPALDFNLHGHVGASTRTLHEEIGITAADYDFTPPSSGDWFLLIRNGGTAAIVLDVTIELHGSMTWSDWQ